MQSSDAAVRPDAVSSQVAAPSSNDNADAAAGTASSAAPPQQEDVPPPPPRIKLEMIDEEDVVMQDAEQQQDEAATGNEESEENGQGNADQGDDEDDREMTIAESDYKRANKLPFSFLCTGFETLWNKKKSPKDNKWSNTEKLEKLLPKKLLLGLKGGDPYPILRLIMPQIDTARPNTGMQEKNIATAWSDALGLGKTSKDAERLKYYTNPNANKNAAGDLSEVVREVVGERYSNKLSRTTVGQVNDFLDELAAIKSGINVGGPRNHDWRDSTGNTTGRASSKKVTNADRRKDWVKQLLQIPLSPLEHKWIVRILLQKVELGVSHKSILGYLSPYADDLYSANNSLKSVCATLSDPEWVRRRKEREEKEERVRREDKWQKYMPRSSAAASLGNTISPMLANRTTFEDAMTDIENRHRKHAKELDDGDALANSLALKFPTFICEVKLDGERMLIHIKRGSVTIQTRNSKWYSNLYCPTLAPPLRRAIQKYNVDVILDGEIISWDNGRQEIIPFGANRTVANDRRSWCAKQGLLEERDLNHHQDEEDINVMNRGTWDKRRSIPGGIGDSEPGADCWLKYIVFDVLYVGGPDAARLISEATTLTGDAIPTGSILNLSGFDRKKILYRLIDPQANEVEIVPSLVVRRNGRSENAATYFSPTAPLMESDLPCSTVDSVERVVKNDVPNYEAIDAEARGSKTDDEISTLRAGAMNKFYVDIVENQGLEGLIFKDLLAPYCVGDQSRNLRYWNKMKPDYDSQGHSASDIDAVVIGAYYATGMAKSGQLNAFLLGCVDQKNPGHYMTLCKVNGGSIGFRKLLNIYDHTDFKKNEDGTVSYGKWFRESNHGKSLPDFISQRSYQQGSETSTGWVCQAKKYPELWIDPDDSVVLTLNCGEVTTSDEFSAGVSLRFPRIEKVRLETVDGGVKPASEVETCEKLHQLYREMTERRKEGSLEFDSSSRPSSNSGPSRFLTTDENTKRKKSKPKKDTLADRASQMPRVEKKDSAALSGVTFVVLEGNYSLDEDSLDAEEAKEEGWFDEARKVKSRMDVLEFIARHSGTSKVAISSDTDVILGGRVNDARVAMHARMLDSDSDPGKKDAALIRLRQLGGIVKWTYVYSSVRRWIDEASQVKIEEEPSGQQLTARGPPTIANTQLARPSRHDYLVLGKSAQLDDEGEVFGIQVWKDINIFDLKRGLEEVQRSKRREKEDRAEDKKRLKLKGQLSKVQTGKDALVPWQYAAINSLPACDRWVLAGDLEKLWSFQLHNADDDGPRPTVIYPDLFNDCGLHDNQDVLEEVLSMDPSTRWEELSPEARMSSLSSTLPLARTMGAQVTLHLHDGVTHVLCLLRGCENVTWDPNDFQPELFKDQDRAMKLHRRLLGLHEEGEPVAVEFVSPKWVRAQFDGAPVT